MYIARTSVQAKQTSQTKVLGSKRLQLVVRAVPIFRFHVRAFFLVNAGDASANERGMILSHFPGNVLVPR